MLSWSEPATPYELKQRVQSSVGYFWSLQHAQLYTETERLARAGLLTEEREQGGRRRRRYALTARGRRALEEWLAAPTSELPELRDLGMLKIFFGADPHALAPARLQAHEALLRRYQEIRRQVGDRMPAGPGLTLERGIAYEREWIRFWRRLAQ